MAEYKRTVAEINMGLNMIQEKWTPMAQISKIFAN